MEGQGISLDAVAVIGVFNLQGLCDAVIFIGPVLIQFTLKGVDLLQLVIHTHKNSEISDKR